jgi:hypothetical protein
MRAEPGVTGVGAGPDDFRHALAGRPPTPPIGRVATLSPGADRARRAQGNGEERCVGDGAVHLIWGHLLI